MKLIYAARLYLCCLLLCAAVAVNSPSLSAANTAESNKQGIEVSTYEADGATHVVVKTLVQFTPQYFLALMSHSNENCSWIDKCVSVTIFDNKHAAKRVIQTHINAPWPFKDRDMVVTSRSEYDETSNTLTIFIEDASNDIPHHPNRIRMTNVYGQWQMKPYNALFELSYTGTASPNGKIPQSFALHFLKESTQQTFENLQALDQKN
jgi:hypothetical protein